VREQLEHDRVIRLLQAKYKRKFDVAINPGNEQAAPVGPPPSPWFPDLVLYANERSKKLVGVVEVETAESVNHLEAMSQWVAFGKLKVEFHLYVPMSAIDSAKRLCADLQIPASEIWAYSALGDQIRFTAIHRTTPAAPEPRVRTAPEPKPARTREPQPASTGLRKDKPTAAKTAAPPARAKTAARRVAPTPAAKARTTKARSAAPRRSAGKPPARKATAASRAQKRK
jgi:hypothetical protein